MPVHLPVRPHVDMRSHHFGVPAPPPVLELEVRLARQQARAEASSKPNFLQATFEQGRARLAVAGEEGRKTRRCQELETREPRVERGTLRSAPATHSGARFGKKSELQEKPDRDRLAGAGSGCHPRDIEGAILLAWCRAHLRRHINRAAPGNARPDKCWERIGKIFHLSRVRPRHRDRKAAKDGQSPSFGIARRQLARLAVIGGKISFGTGSAGGPPDDLSPWLPWSMDTHRRDVAYVGRDAGARQRSPPLVVDNSRLFIPPWMRIPLASHILALAADMPGADG